MTAISKKLITLLKSLSSYLPRFCNLTPIGAVISHQLTGNHLLLNHPAAFFQTMMVVGLIGIAISVFSID